MGMEMSEDRLAPLLSYADELRKWNKAYNLVSRNMGAEGLARLYVDAISPLCIKNLLGGEREVVDIGSGAGLPGIPLYLVAGPFPITLVESQRKKVTFLRHIRSLLGLSGLQIYPGRLEEMVKEDRFLNSFEVGLARAVTDPLRLARTAKALICEGGRLVLFVGKADKEKIRKNSISLEEKGLKLEAIRSTERIVGRENYLVVLKKASP